MASPYQLTIMQAYKFRILTANLIKTAQFALFSLLKNLKNQQINYKFF